MREFHICPTGDYMIHTRGYVVNDIVAYDDNIITKHTKFCSIYDSLEVTLSFYKVIINV